MCMRALRMWLMTIALGAAVAATGAAAQGAPPANRLALVVGEAAYSGVALPTAAADAALPTARFSTPCVGARSVALTPGNLITVRPAAEVRRAASF